MNKLENYDFGVWGDTDTSLIITAYPLSTTIREDGSKQMECDYSERSAHSLKLRYPTDLASIEGLLGDLYINHYPLTDYDDWLSIEEIQEQQSPLIQEFLDLLPENKLEREDT
jgi:hypothetical protein